MIRAAERARGAQGKIQYVVTALIEYLNVLLEYIDYWAQGKMP